MARIFRDGLMIALLAARPIRLSNPVADPALRSEGLEVLRGLIECVVLRPVDGGFEVERVGAIARMIEAGLGAASKKAAILSDSASCSVKVITGARYLLYRNRRRWVPSAKF